MAAPIRVAIVDDHPLFRDGLVATMNAAPNIAVVAEASSAEEALRVVARIKPDLLLLDICIPGGGIEAAQSIQDLSCSTKVVMLTASEDQTHVLKALDAGAKGYIVKGVGGRELIRAIESVHAGAPYVSPQLAGLLLTTRKSSEMKQQALLTPDELQILENLSAGHTNSEIAASIGLSVRATKRCITQIFRKLRVRNRVEALLAAQKLKLNARP